MATRRLKDNEVDLVRRVFLDTVNVKRIRVSDSIGLNNRPYTMPRMLSNIIDINVGSAYNKDLSSTNPSLLIHEVTHAWQAIHSGWEFSYVFNSAFHQALSGQDAYHVNYYKNKAFEDYEAEEQAMIVQSWYSSGMKTSHRYWPYIRDGLRKPSFGGRAYFFFGDKYLRWTIGTGIDAGYPKKIHDGNWHPILSSGFDACTDWEGDKLYFFKGKEYIRHTRGKGPDQGYPKLIKDHWPGLWQSDIDAAINWQNGTAFFFKGDSYIKWIIGQGMAPGYPKMIANAWPDFMTNGIDAAINWGSGRVYFFKGDEYLRWKIGVGADKNYPRKIKNHWPSFFEHALSGALRYPK